VIVVEPCRLAAVISRMDGIVENSLIIGVATVLAMISGLAPVREAATVMVGMSMRGRAATERCR
jgi:hypothetical protein